VAARAQTERDVGRAREALARANTRDRAERVRLETIAAHATERLGELRAEEGVARAAAPDPAARERGAAIERILAERRRLSVEAAIVAEPRYLTEALGRRPEGLRRRLEWEGAADTVERHRQLLGVRDRDRALGEEPSVASQRAEWQRARRELEAVQARVAKRDLTRDRERVAGIGIER
jgi:prophage tail gpP-like protein